MWTNKLSTPLADYPGATAPTVEGMLPEADWYATLPGHTAGAIALLRDAQGRVLLVKPVYRGHWIGPGGTVEDGETGRDACSRELAEELGLVRQVGRLLVVDWVLATTNPDWDRAHISFVFDAGRVEESELHRAANELEAAQFFASSDLDSVMRPAQAARMRAACRAAATGSTIFLESGASTDRVLPTTPC